jgi:hypothetical protein
MKRFFTMSATAAGFALMLGLHASAQQQQPLTSTPTSTGDQTKITAEHAQTTTFTGCLQTGTEAKTYILDKVVPIKTTTEMVGTSGESATVTKYELVPSEEIALDEHVGRKVEVTGVLVPAGKGEAKIKTESKLPGQEERTEAKIEKGPTPQFRVISIKRLADSCSN